METKETRRMRVREFVLRNPLLPDADIVSHFVLEGYCRATCYRTLERIRKNESMKKKAGGGKKEQKMTSRMRDRIVVMMDNNDKWSIRSLSRHLKKSRQVITKWLKELGIVRKKKKKAPYANEKQKQKQKRILHVVSRDEFRASNDARDVIMDDETYFDMNGYDFGGNDSYFTSGTDIVPDHVKFKMKTKFPGKLLLWIAVSRKGYSKPYFHRQSQGAINQQIYQSECIIKRLIPFIKKHYSEEEYIFWPDLASSHYAANTQALLMHENVTFLAKEKNPPNVPQTRPIERFWAHLKAKVFTPPYHPQNIDCLEKRIKKILKEFQPEYFERLMSAVGPKVRAAANNGPLSVIN